MQYTTFFFANVRCRRLVTRLFLSSQEIYPWKMSELIENRQVFTLKEVSESIKRTLASRYTTAFWIKAEMNKLNFYKHSRHCYPDLVQKEAGKVVAQMRATLWADDYQRVNEQFIKITGEKLTDGITILFKGNINYDANYGLTLQIIDIDPIFALGELEREKLETIQRLKAEGVFELNKRLSLPLLPKRVAIISVSTSKGYADFLQLTQSRMINFRMEHILFPSLLQGDKAAGQIVKQLERIKKVAHHFDLVAIIRGGGGEVGLAAYNDYSLAKTIAQFPLPVITGIGHATNLTVAEMTAHTFAITPSELADMLLIKFEQFIHKLNISKVAMRNGLKQIATTKQLLKYQIYSIQSNTNKQIFAARNELIHLQADFRFSGQKHLNGALNSVEAVVHRYKSNSKQLLGLNMEKLGRLKEKIQSVPAQFVDNKWLEMKGVENSVKLLSPKNVLKRGYSISFTNDGLLLNAHQLKEGDEVKTLLGDGSFTAKVTKVNNTKSHEI